VSNIVLLDSGDQVTILRCVNGVPTVVDSLDLSAWGDTSTGHNISWERVSATETTQLSTNWKEHRAVSKSSVSYSGYLPGGTPGALNTNSCATGYAYHDGACVAGPEFWVGTYHQNSYQDDWQASNIWIDNQANGFREEMVAGGAAMFFSRDLGVGMEYQLEDSSLNSNADDTVGSDSVDIVLIGTHGGENGSLTMWEKDHRAYVFRMRLGDDGRQLSLLALWACDTMDENGSGANALDRFARWANAFSGGLRYAVGFHNDHMLSITTNEDGEDFAKKLNEGMTIRNAFNYAMTDWAQDIGIMDDHDPTVAASGRNASDCERRLNGMTLDNMVGTERLRDNQVGTLCFYDIHY